MSIAADLRRGVVAGLLAGLLAGLFGLLVAEPTIDRAIRLEHQHADAAAQSLGHASASEPFTRDTQRVGLIVGTAVTGTAVGALFALAYAAGRRLLGGSGTRPWSRSLRLALSGFVGVFALPFLRYPANPPGVGDPETIGSRTALWVGSIVVGLASVSLVVIARRHLARRGWGEPVQDLAAGGIVVLGLAALFLLPANTDPVETDANLLWTFRLLSVAAQAVLWSSLGTIFGLLAERAAGSPLRRRRPAALPSS